MSQCDQCKFWWSYDGEAKDFSGLCRRHPPTCDMKGEFTLDSCGTAAVWPTTHYEDWCGEFKRGPRGDA